MDLGRALLLESSECRVRVAMSKEKSLEELKKGKRVVKKRIDSEVKFQAAKVASTSSEGFSAPG